MRPATGQPVVLSVSGGKDSTATGLFLREAGIPFQAIHMDTGWEHGATEEYVRDYLPEILGPIKVLRSKHGGMRDLCLRKGMFPSRQRRWCTQELKVFPFQRHMATLADPVSVVGIRAEESKARAKMPEVEEYEDKNCAYTTWRPLLRWSFDDVVAIHKRHNVKPNPLYLLGAERVGCWPCIFMRKAELRLMGEIDPGRVGAIRELEAEVCARARARLDAKGETFESLDYAGPCFFRARARVVDPTTGKKVWGRHDWGIDRVMGWACGAGSAQGELFGAGPEDAGCMRWGLCDMGVTP